MGTRTISPPPSAIAAARLEPVSKRLFLKKGGYGIGKGRDCAVAAALGMDVGRG